jgi:DNA segregation ATPase FtsK/SpoIIIE, S-DNA-T family
MKKENIQKKKKQQKLPAEKNEGKDSRNTPKVKSETKETIQAIGLFVLAAFFILASFGKGGSLGSFTYESFGKLFGLGYYLFPIIFVTLSFSFLSDHERVFTKLKMFSSVLFIGAGLGLIHIARAGKGGAVGSLFTDPLLRLFDTPVSVLILLGVLVASLLLIFESSFRIAQIKQMVSRKHQGVDNIEYDEELEEDDMSDIEEARRKLKDKKNPALLAEDDTSSKTEDRGIVDKVKDKISKIKDSSKEDLKNEDNKEDGAIIAVSRKNVLLGKPFVAPPLSLLEMDKGKPNVGDTKANSNIIKRTLQNFGIDVEMDDVTIGPSVTRYALKPAEGVKLSRILGLQNNLSLALAAHPLRIEAPIPGKSLVGIEVPNSTKTTVGLGSMLGHDDFQKSEKPLMMALGKGISGKAYFANLAKAPHMLIAGATGSGKSVTIHAIITSLLYRNSPQNLRMIMIDPKRVELTLYDKIPHLLTPVIKDAKKAIMALRWGAKEMDRRYDVLEKHSVRDIDSYHKNILYPALEKRKKDGVSPETTDKDDLDPMPYIVIVIDELADIMQTYPRELEAGIVRLAQMSRAVGIHLILSTQRPSVNVITGLIKANVPTRIALQVASQVDSRTILDMRGAEELLGAGDMLYLGGEMSSPQRIQSAFVTESELKKVVKHLCDNNVEDIGGEIQLGEKQEGVNDPIFSDGVTISGGDPDAEDDDLYEEAKAVVIEAGKASTSYLQRKLRVGYARAARLMDILEDKGVVGPADGAKPREVIGHSGNSNSDENDSE